jgi:amino acid adenylation domain-containing protein
LEGFRLSPAQYALWAYVTTHRSGPSYNVPTIIEVDGPVDHQVLADALMRAIRRHPSMGCLIRLEEGSPLQFPHGLDEPPAAYDFARMGLQEQRASLRRLMQRMTTMPFDLARGPLTRAAIVRLSPTSSRVLLVVHHLVFDGLSQNVLFRDLENEYTGAAGALQGPSAYRDAIEAQWAAAGAAASEGDTFWREQAAVFAQHIYLPQDRQRATADEAHGGHIGASMGIGQREALQAVATSVGSSPFTVLLAAWHGLMHRYGNGVSTVAIAADTRTPEAQSMTGYFVNNVPAFHATSDVDLHELVEQTHQNLKEVLRHRTYPLADVVRTLGSPVLTSGFPTRVLFTYRRGVPSTTMSDGTRMRLVGLLPNWGAKTDLVVRALDDGGDLTFMLEYDRAIWSRKSAERVLADYRALIHGMSDGLSAPLGLVSLATSSDRARSGCGTAARHREVPGTVLDLFMAQVAAGPERVALIDGSEKVTYRELERRAAAIAHLLGPTSGRGKAPIAILIPPSTDLIAAILGVLKSGVPYLPIDPTSPADRIRNVLEDSGASSVVTTLGQLDSLPSGTWQPVVVDSAAARAVTESAADLPPISPGSLAYIIYTSGSSGRPKGVAVQHVGVRQLAESTRQLLNVSDQDVWTLFHSSAFDISVWEMWGALAHGGRLVIVDSDTARSPETYWRLLHDHRVTIICHTPTSFSQFDRVDADMGSQLALRVMVLGGESLDARTLGPWFARHGDACPEIWNGYGPTEATVFATFRRMLVPDVRRSRLGSMIGTALPHLSVVVLDKWGREAPQGALGEIVIAGDAVAERYWQRDDLTRECFFEYDSIADGPVRAYRSGDFARQTDFGDIEFLGRMDNQVKIRGYRIELGEIESVLREGRGVSDAVVVAAGDEGNKQLLAFLRPSDDGPTRPVDENELRLMLRQRLPAYMVPSTLYSVASFPMNRSGKVDRDRIATKSFAGTATRLGIATSGGAARKGTALQQRIADTVASVLKLDYVDPSADYYDIGGDSLSAVEIAWRLQRDLRVEISPIDIMTASCVGDIAASCSPLAERLTVLGDPSTGSANR